MRTAVAIAAALLLVSAPAAAQRPDPKLPGARPGQPAPSATTGEHKNETIPLSKYGKHRELLSRASQEAPLIDFQIKAATKEFEADQHALGVRTSCVRFKASSGFRLKVDRPKFSAAGDTLTIDQNIAKIAVDGLHAKFQLGPCLEHSVKFGIVASNVHFIYKAKPMVSFDGKGLCKLKFNPETQKINVKIGGFNAHGVQNDLDKLVKRWLDDTLEDSLNGLYGMHMGNTFVKVALDFCGK